VDLFGLGPWVESRKTEIARSETAVTGYEAS